MSRASTIRVLAVSCALFTLGAALPDLSQATAPFSLFTRSDLPVGPQNSIAPVDLNGDGKVDLATAFYQSYVSVYLGNGNGTFGAPSTFPVGGPLASSVTTGDLNGDGRADLLLSWQNGVSALLGAGDGTFGPPLTFATSSAPKYVRTADFNNDGKLDALVNGPELFVRLGNGNGTFGARMGIPFTGCPYGEPIHADFNADGRIDLAVPNGCPFGAVSIFLGNGDGTFRPQVDNPVQSLPDFSDVGDLNGDGRPDIVVSNFNSGSVSILLGNGDGTFQPRTDIDIGLETAGVKVGDFNTDGIPDIGATTHGTHILFLLAGRGDGTFEPKIGFSTSPHPYSLQKGDLNGDGLLDLLTPVAAPLDGISIFMNATGPPAGNAPVITAPGSLTVAEGAQVTFTVTAFDPDGDPITSLTADVCCAGRTFTTNASNTSGTFSWTACCGTPAPYYVVFVARNALASQATTYITVTSPGGNQPVVLAPIGNKTVDEQSLLSFTASATDPDAGQTLGFSMVLGTPAATGAVIDTATGVFTWTPTEAQGPAQYPMTVRVTDNASFPSYDFESIQVNVREVNVAPVLAPIGSKTACGPGAPLTFTATATDTDIPSNTLTFSLGPGAPAGATMNGSTGAFSWTPSSSGSFPVTVRVTDNGTPPLDDFEVVTIILGAGRPNQAPVLAAIGSRTIDELTPLTFTAVSSDPDPCPGETFTFSLDSGAPTGAAINGSTGAFAWTPAEFQGPGSFPVTVRVTDNGSPPLSDFETITVMVNDVNSAPVVANPGNKFVTMLSTLAFTVTATDSDIPANTVAFSLTLGTPAATGATINSSTGAFSWTPTQAQANQVYPLTITATDNGTPTLSGSAAITITVLQDSVPPVVTNPGNKTTAELTNLAFTVTATDPDVPPMAISWSLTLGTPAASGVTIGSTTGAFSWTPTETQGPGLYPVTIVATDNGSPQQSGFAAISIMVTEVNSAPVLATIGNRAACLGQPMVFTATATDADIPANALTFSLDAGAPPGATINSSTGAFSWTPSGFGNFPVTVRVTDNGTPPLSDFEVIASVVGDCHDIPVLGAIGNKTVNELALLAFTATATDPSPGAVLTFSLDAGAPAGTTINGSTGAFRWTPTEAHGPGNYPITVRVSNNATPPSSDFETIAVTVNEVNSAPVVTNPGNRIVNVPATLALTVTATDSDLPANVITWSLTLGSPAATGATINSSTGAFSWTPTQAQANQVYPVTITATDNGTPVLSGSAAIAISVSEGCPPPVLTQPADMTVTEGGTADQQLTAFDGGGGPLTFSKVSGPLFMTVSATGNVHLAPGFADLGVYSGTVQVTSGPPCVASDTKTFQITVGQPLSVPTADAGGPYIGTVSAPVNFDGTGSFDPAGEPLMYLWTFGDGSTGVGVTPTHTYTTSGTYIVTLRVTDPGALYDDDATTATILAEIPVTLLLKNGKSTINLGDDVLKLGIEELEQPYSSVLVSTLRLSTDFPNAGTVAECAADTKHTRIGDLDRNGVPDLELRFPIACIRNLFRNTPNNSTVNLILTGQFQTSTGMVPLRGVRAFTIKRGGAGSAAVLAYPNPFNPQGRLSFATTRPGSASIQLFDLQGRLVRTLLPQQYLAAGAHEITIDGLNDQGTRLSSGVYYYRVWTADGIMEGSVNILK